MTKMMKRKMVPKLPPDEVARIKEMAPTVDELRIIDVMRDYRAIRNARFGKTIPPVELVFIRFIPRREMERFCSAEDGMTIGACLAGRHLGSPMPYVIALAEDANVLESRFTLLHEMAHLKVNIKFQRNMGHGRYWKREMRRLAAVGAMDDWW